MSSIVWDDRQPSPAALKTIGKYFEQSLLDINYFNALASLLDQHGFKRDNSIVLVNSCRDELARPISHYFDKNYGHTFNLSGIAGIITAGSLGFHAATGHAPTNPDGRPKYVFFASTHAAVDEHGAEGIVLREGQNKEGHACGAIEAIKGEIEAGVHQTGAIRDTDVEYDILKKKVFAHDPAPSKTPTNLEITKITIDVITKDLEAYIKTVDTSNADYFVFTSVQIHSGVQGGEPGSHLDYFAPVEGYAVIGGKKSAIKTDGKTFSLEK